MTDFQASIQTIQVAGWTLRVREPDGPAPHQVIFLLHGWTGDENVMWVFAPRLPENAFLIAPRALHAAPEGGYSWQPRQQGVWPAIDDFRPAVDRLLSLFTALQSGVPGMIAVDTHQVNLIGFSQGAALAYSLAIIHPERVNRLAGLAGFLPENANELVVKRPLEGKTLFVAHGTKDEIVPVARARQSVGLLEKAGAKVILCEEDVGHKLSAGCFRGLGKYFQE